MDTKPNALSLAYDNATQRVIVSVADPGAIQKLLIHGNVGAERLKNREGLLVSRRRVRCSLSPLRH
jgi:hypothetical protein